MNIRIDAIDAVPYECQADNVKAAINEYIYNRPKFEKGFALNQVNWEAITANIDNVEHLVELVNGLCKNDRYKITGIISNYTINYPSEVE